MREKLCRFMPFWEVVLDKDKEILASVSDNIIDKKHRMHINDHGNKTCHASKT